MEQILSIFADSGHIYIYFMIFVLLIGSGLGIFSEDVTFIATGYVAYKGMINPYIAIVIGIVGVMSGDSFLYFIGYKFGKKVFSLPVLKNLFTVDRLAKASLLLQKKGKFLVFAIRFLPGFRAPSYFSCGTLGIRYRYFIITDAVAACISVPLLIFLSMKSGKYIDRLIYIIRQIENSLIVLACLLIFLFVMYSVGKNKKKRANHAE
jgi:membrane protein DedA with SNARE-associated domain